MNLMGPQIPKELTRVADFFAYARNFLLDESPVLKIKNGEERIADTDFLRVDIRKSIFENCTFHHCNFEKASFIDVLFQSCDLSNSKFAGAYFERCRLVSCKCMGVDMSDTVVKQTVLEQSNFQYSAFNQTKMTDVFFDQIDFAEASLVEAKLKRFAATGSRFVKTNFFKTLLATVDFSNNELVAPIVSTPPVELKGAIVNMFQAAHLMSLWDVIVKP